MIEYSDDDYELSVVPPESISDEIEREHEAKLAGYDDYSDIDEPLANDEIDGWVDLWGNR